MMTYKSILAAPALCLFLALPVMAQGVPESVELRLSTAEDEIRRITGHVEQLQYSLREQERLQRRLDALEKQLQQTPPAVVGTAGSPVSATTPQQPTQLGSGTSTTTAPASAAPAASSTEPTLRASNSTEAYNNAFALIQRADFAAAETAFTAFLQQYPNDRLVPNAQYWLGETYYVRGNYGKAAEIFLKSYQDHPKGSKAADNLLKLGLSMSALGNKEQACRSFQRLRNEYPKADTPVLQRATDEINKLNCG